MFLKKYIPIFLTLIVFMLSFGYEFTISNRGLDLNDGGWSLLRASFPESELAGMGRDSHYMHSLFILFEGSVAALRIASIILLLIALIIFVSGILRVYFDNHMRDRLFGLQFFLLIGISTIPCFWIERQPSYNILGTFSFFTAIGSALFAVHFRKKDECKLYFLLLIITGLFIAFGFLTRFPIVGPTFVILVLLYYYSFKLNKFFHSALILLTGIILGLAVHCSLYESPKELINIYKNGWELANISYTESIQEKLERQSLEILSVWQVALGRHKLAMIFSFLIVTIFPKSRIWILIPAIIWVTITSYSHGDLNGGFSLFSNYYRFWSSLGFILFPILFFRLDLLKLLKTKVSKFVMEVLTSTTILIVFLMLPQFCAIGAGSTLIYMSNFFGCLYPIVLIIVAKRNGFFHSNFEKYFYWVIFVLCISPTITHYNSRLNSSLFSVDGSSVKDCIFPTEVGFYPNKIAMSGRQSKLLSEINKILTGYGFEKGTKILNFTDLPGLLYAVGGDFNIQAWTNVHHGSPVPYFMQNAKIKDIKSSWILLDANNWSDRIEVSFNSRSIDLYNTHHEIGKFDKFKIYKPRACNN